MVQIDSKWSNIFLNGPKRSLLVQDGKKWPNMVQNGQKCPKRIQYRTKKVQQLSISFGGIMRGGGSVSAGHFLTLFVFFFILLKLEVVINQRNPHI